MWHRTAGFTAHRGPYRPVGVKRTLVEMKSQILYYYLLHRASENVKLLRAMPNLCSPVFDVASPTLLILSVEL